MLHKYKNSKKKLSKNAQGKYVVHINSLLIAKLLLKLSLLIKDILKRSVLQIGNVGSTFLSLSVAGSVLESDLNKG